MEISRTATGILALVCLTAGAGGAFLALRHSTPDVRPEQLEPAGETTAVAESEVVVDGTPAGASAALPAPSREPRPARTPQSASAAPRRTAPPKAQPRPEPTRGEPVASEPPQAVIPVEPPLVTDNQASQTVPPPGPVYEELVVAAESVIGLQLESTISSERARVEDAVAARVTRDVRVGDRVVIPAGARAFGQVTLVERGGKLKERARLGVRFTSIVLADGTRLPIQTETVFREGDPPGGESAAKIGGGAIGGAILGGILGGAKGAAIGGSIGAGAGSAAVMIGGRNPATLSAGTPLTVRLEDPVVVTVER